MNAFALVALARELEPRAQPAVRARMRAACASLVELLALPPGLKGSDALCDHLARIPPAIAELRESVVATGFVARAFVEDEREH